MRRAVAAWAWSWALACALVASSAMPCLAACKLEQWAQFPVAMNGLRPTTQVGVGLGDLHFLIDSGATDSMLNPQTVKRLNLFTAMTNHVIRGVGGQSFASAAHLRDVTVAGQKVSDLSFYVVEAGAGTGDGIIGQTILGLADTEYDLANGYVRLTHPNGCGGANLAYWASADISTVPLIEMAPTYDTTGAIDVLVNGVKLRALLDTGATGTVMTVRAAARAGITPQTPGVVANGLSSGIGASARRSWIAPVASFKVGDETTDNIKLVMAEIDLDGVDMLLGVDFFLTHRVYVSKREDKVYFTRNIVATATPGSGADAALIPTDADGFSRRGAAFAARKDWEHAIADDTRAVDMAPSEPHYVFQRAAARVQNHQAVLAMGDLDQALKLDPTYLDALILRAELRAAARDTAGAGEDLAAAARLAPKDADTRLNLGGLYIRVNLYDLAIEQLDLWIASHADDGRMSQALNMRCLARGVQGRELDKALGDCNRAVQGSPKTAGFLLDRGIVRLRRGENDRAAADFTAAFANEPKMAVALYGRSLAEARLGQGDQAKTDADAATALQPQVAAIAKRDGMDVVPAS